MCARVLLAHALRAEHDGVVRVGQAYQRTRRVDAHRAILQEEMLASSMVLGVGGRTNHLWLDWYGWLGEVVKYLCDEVW